jgi:hypothetical protein
MILTRYLYSKERLLLVLLKCLSLKLENESLIFAYELYFSGFESELWDCIWKHYYLYCHVLNPEYERFLKKQEKLSCNKNDLTLIKKCIIELIIRPYFYIGKSEYIELSLEELIKTYKNPSFNPYNRVKIINIISRPIKNFEKEIVISRILLLNNKPKQLKRQFYIEVDKNECDKFETIEEPYCNSRYILISVIKYNLLDYLSYEEIKNTESIDKQDFIDNWIIYAYNCPLWKKRIEMYTGKIINGKLIFNDDDFEEKFWDKHDLDPDEQPIEIQIKLNYDK